MAEKRGPGRPRTRAPGWLRSAVELDPDTAQGVVLWRARRLQVGGVDISRSRAIREMVAFAMRCQFAYPGSPVHDALRHPNPFEPLPLPGGNP